MPGRDDGLGKDAEGKIKQWLDRPEEGYSFDRIPDQMTGFYGSKNICDFICFKSPNMYYIESKATWQDRFDFSLITETQHDGLLRKSQIPNVYGLVIVLFASHKRAFVINIRDIEYLENQGKKSLNINKEDKWGIPHKEIRCILNNRKKFYDYEGDIEEYIPEIC